MISSTKVEILNNALTLLREAELSLCEYEDGDKEVDDIYYSIGELIQGLSDKQSKLLSTKKLKNK